MDNEKLISEQLLRLIADAAVKTYGSDYAAEEMYRLRAQLNRQAEMAKAVADFIRSGK